MTIFFQREDITSKEALFVVLYQLEYMSKLLHNLWHVAKGISLRGHFLYLYILKFSSCEQLLVDIPQVSILNTYKSDLKILDVSIGWD